MHTSNNTQSSTCQKKRKREVSKLKYTGFQQPLLYNGLLVSASVTYVCMIEMITYLS